MSEHQANSTQKPKRLAKWVLPAGIVAALGVGYMLWPQGATEVSAGTTFLVKRGDLQVAVLTGGTSEAIESQEIRSEIEGRDGAKILEIVEEGYFVTPEDVENGKVLVRLDSAQLEDKLVNQEKQFESARATLIETQAAYDIQLNQNKSDITAAELLSKFAKMDLQKYLGQATVGRLLAELGLDERAKALAEAPAPMTSLELDVRPRTAMDDIRPPRRGSSASADSMRSNQSPRRPSSDGPPAGMGRGGERGEGQGSGEWRGRREDQAGGRPNGSAGGERRRPPMDDGPSIPLDDELIDAIVAAAAENGMPMEPERFKQMLKSGAGEGTPKLSLRMAERMKSMGVDIMAIAEKLGKSTEAEEKVKAPDPNAAAAALALSIDSEYMEKRSAINFSKYADPTSLEDGEAKQELRRMQDEGLVAVANFQLAESDLEATRRLVENNFETQTNLDRQTVTVQTSKIKKESAQVARELYIKYEFPKQVELLLSDYEESLANLERTRAEAAARLLQAESRLRSAEKDDLRETQRLEEDRDQLSKCVILAERSGMVVYGSSNARSMYRGGSSEPIQEGTAVRERQLILTIPDMSEMSVTVKVHESAIKNIEKGQTASVVIESHPDEVVKGEVTKVGVLPDSSDRWMNPDIKQYNVTLKIEGTRDWFRPGMSAEVEILVNTYEDVLYIPIQSVTAIGRERACWVMEGGKAQRRVIDTGAFNDDFIEVESGLNEGDIVLLRSPEASKTISPFEGNPQPKQSPSKEAA